MIKNKRTLKQVLIIFWCLVGIYIFADQSSEKYTTLIDRYINEAKKLDAFSGTVLVTKDNRVIYERASGYANLSYQIKNNIHTKFNVGSIGKVFTATAIMQLVQNGKLNLDDTLDKFLPDFPYAEKKQITIEQLLNHTAGTGNFFDHPDFYVKRASIRETSDFLSLIYEMKLVAKPGEKYQYSNSGMALLGAVIEKVSGKLYRKYIDENIFQPLAMQDTGFVYLEDIVYNRATGYIPKNVDEFQSNIFVSDRPCSAGGIYSTVYDLSKFDQGLKTERILKKQYIQRMYKPSIKNPRYGLGWKILSFKDHKLIGHSGGHYGLEAIFYRYIENGYTIIVLSNYTRGARHVASAIENIIFTGEFTPVDTIMLNARKCFTLEELGKHKEAIEAIDINIIGDHPHLQSLYLSARLRIKAGFELKKAIQLLDTFLKMAPDPSNPSKAAAWWRKGTAYEKMKNLNKAVECYKKSLKLDPKFSYAKESLESLTQKK